MASPNPSVAKAWQHALELTAPITRQPRRVLPTVIEELADQHGEAPALLSGRECLTYAGLAAVSNRYSRWALARGLAKGDTVCLLMSNRPEYMAIWLGLTRVGVVVPLLNTNLAGPSLAHCMNIAAPSQIIVGAELVGSLISALPGLTGGAEIWVYGPWQGQFPRIDHEMERQAGDSLTDDERRPVTIEDPALYIYTSGTTGLPKAARVSHYRLMQASYWFAGMMDVSQADRMYNCLPMYHSVGGVQALGSVLVGGGSVVIREKFSASQFWQDVVRWDCTLFQYIGELCRYLLHTPSSPYETEHRIRMCCGNGLRPDVWNEFKSRFRIPKIFEFYGATEGNVSLFNIEGKPGAIGRIPRYLAHRFPSTLVRYDVEQDEPVRTDEGLCVVCRPNEIGEAIGKVDGESSITSRFEGYTTKEESDKRLLHNVFEPGDTWFRTGDLMRKDESGFFYFVDRVGDTFRWKGENVATSEVSETICMFPGIKQANVYGVTVAGNEGRAGMAALVTDEDIDLEAFWRHLANLLPAYARPLFLRVGRHMEVTPTFKHLKHALVRQGFDPGATEDVIYFNDPETDGFVAVDKALYDRIQAGQVRV